MSHLKSSFSVFSFILLVGSVSKEPACNAGDTGDSGLIPRSGRSPAGGNGNPLQYSCLKIPLDRGAWWAMLHRVAKSQTWLSSSTYRVSYAPGHSKKSMPVPTLVKVFPQEFIYGDWETQGLSFLWDQRLVKCKPGHVCRPYSLFLCFLGGAHWRWQKMKTTHKVKWGCCDGELWGVFHYCSKTSLLS